MKISWVAGAAVAVALLLGVLGGNLLHLKGTELIIFVALLGVLGLGAAAAISYFQAKENAPPAAAAPAGDGAKQRVGRAGARGELAPCRNRT